MMAASKLIRPRPSRLKITSISKEPVKKMPMNAEGKPAITSSMALRNTWPYSTRGRLRPLALAVTTYCLLISSRKLFLVSKVMVAKLPMTSAVIGSTRCQK
ncbi:hypothetical protein D3C81_1405700 [compost metagenome]